VKAKEPTVFLNKPILLTTINAKWIHPSLALRLLKTNLGELEAQCEIIEFALRQPLAEKTEPILAARPRILGISVSIWNHAATVELFAELEKAWAETKPVVVLGGPEVSYLPPTTKIFRYADYVIRGEGEAAFRALCENILTTERSPRRTVHIATKFPAQFINAEPVNLSELKSGYHFYTDEDAAKKLIYVEASRGCPFSCEFCAGNFVALGAGNFVARGLSAVKEQGGVPDAEPEGRRTKGLRFPPVREFALEPFLAEMDVLVRRGAKTFKFLDRTFNLNIKRTLRICEFFLEKIAEGNAIVVHFEMVPSLFPPELREILTRFPPGTLRLEIGVQTLNPEIAARIGRVSNPEKELENIRFIREKTNAIIHVDLIAGLPGEDIASFGMGFDRLWRVLSGAGKTEIQLGILKLLPGAPIARHNETFGMRYSLQPPYEVLETSAMSAADIERIKNFARFWELIVNRRLVNNQANQPVFDDFMALSDALFAHFGRNWGIDKSELMETIVKYLET
jgi:hypothetical protein